MTDLNSATSDSFTDLHLKSATSIWIHVYVDFNADTRKLLQPYLQKMKTCLDPVSPYIYTVSVN